MNNYLVKTRYLEGERDSEIDKNKHTHKPESMKDKHISTAKHKKKYTIAKSENRSKEDRLR